MTVGQKSSSGWRSGLVAAGLASGLTVGSAVVSVPSGLAAPSTDAAIAVTHDRVVSEVPASWTPQVKDGRVLSIAQVGTSMVAAGTFTQVSAANGSGLVGRQGVFAFNATTGAITGAFNPTVDGAINVVFPGPSAGTVYVAGTFRTVNGVASDKVALLDVSTGAVVTSFKAPGINGAVQDLVKLGNRLYLGGAFTTVNGFEHKGLATLNATTGARDPFMGVDVSVNHNWTEGSTGARGAVGVKALAIAPSGQRLVAIGNFKQADGLIRDQAVMVELGAATAQVANWRTRRYEPACFSGAFDSYVRDVDFSPDGSYFVIATTGDRTRGRCATRSRGGRLLRRVTVWSRSGSTTPAATRCTRGPRPAQRCTPAGTSGG
jgi:WD40 repeat protein